MGEGAGLEGALGVSQRSTCQDWMEVRWFQKSHSHTPVSPHAPPATLYWLEWGVSLGVSVAFGIVVVMRHFDTGKIQARMLRSECSAPKWPPCITQPEERVGVISEPCPLAVFLWGE
ncbi:hypothetical protein JZ751_013608 [Albula glossodonta]|uniref:Uncharacterized protein n=1 Tax=Albula glossodonta TaxID=121402 RepID=A0A8T2NTF2_9TELE|nr:hypothetical protein JZ751_013608 [Albula glossodonta]